MSKVQRPYTASIVDHTTKYRYMGYLFGKAMRGDMKNLPIIRPGIRNKDVLIKVHDAIHAVLGLDGKSTAHKSPGSSNTGVH